MEEKTLKELLDWVQCPYPQPAIQEVHRRFETQEAKIKELEQKLKGHEIGTSWAIAETKKAREELALEKKVSKKAIISYQDCENCLCDSTCDECEDRIRAAILKESNA